MSFDSEIPNLMDYRKKMMKSMVDKIYFIDKVEAEVFVDYGCADGAMLHIMQGFSGHELVGFDISEDMLELARKENPDILFSSNWEDIMNAKKGKTSALVLSSVIHEVYHYGSASEIMEFWDRVWNSGFDYVVIRDMMVSRSTSRISNPLSVARIRQCYDSNKISEWEANWGSLHENWSLTHFLLTYQYQDNWARELKENYLPNSLEDFMPLIPKMYVPTYFEHYTLPYTRMCIERDFGIQLQDNTHLKLILQKKNL